MGKSRRAKIRDLWEGHKKFEVSVVVHRDNKFFESYLLTNISAKDLPTAINLALGEAAERVSAAKALGLDKANEVHTYGYRVVNSWELDALGHPIPKSPADGNKKGMVVAPPVPAMVFSCPITALCTTTKVLGSPRASTQL